MTGAAAEWSRVALSRRWPLLAATAVLVAGLAGCQRQEAGLGAGAAAADASATARAERQQHEARGTVVGVDRAGGALQIAHGPVPTLEWPAGTTAFRVQDTELLDRFREGDAVRFSFILTVKEQYVITDIAAGERA